MAFLLVVAGISALPLLLAPEKSTSATPSENILKLRKKQADKEREEVRMHAQKTLHGVSKGRSFSYASKRKATREGHIRRILENLFEYRFISIRPEWLLNPKTNRRLEIDCYCRELNLAVEFQGEQHYKYIPYFHRTHQVFLDQQARDGLKRTMLKLKGINYLEIPFTVSDGQLEAYILQHCNKFFK
jgi:hypothetical protein